MNLVTLISTAIESGKRIVKFYRLGKVAETAPEVNAYGLDSNAIKSMIAVYAKTGNNGDDVIIGYINKNQKAGVGEFRIYSTDDKGNEKFYTWLKNDGTIEIGGNTNFAVKYNELQVEFNKLKTNFNNHLNEYNTHLHTVSGSATLVPTVPSTQTNTSDITQTKNDKIKTI